MKARREDLATIPSGRRHSFSEMVTADVTEAVKILGSDRPCRDAMEALYYGSRFCPQCTTSSELRSKVGFYPGSPG
jgi:hypothetical protein